MHQLSVDDLTRLRALDEPPCISLYQPTHRYHPDNRQDPIRYRNLRRRLETTLSRAYPSRDVRDLLSKYLSLELDFEFWNHRTEGLAILSSPQTFEVFDLQRPVRERLVIAPNFYTKPLLRILQSADRYQILCLRMDEITLYEGNRDVIDPVDLTDTLQQLDETLGPDDVSAEVAVRVAPGGVAIHYGVGQDLSDVNRERFFRAVDRAILELHSRPSGLPLMLAALPEYHSHYRGVSHNPFLLADGVRINPDALSVEKLRIAAWEQFAPFYKRRLEAVLREYELAKTRSLASDDVTDVASATISGRVRTLLVEADRELPGRIDEEDGRIQRGEASDPDTGDVLNDLAESVARMKGDVIVVPAEQMPTTSGIAAVYRF